MTVCPDPGCPNLQPCPAHKPKRSPSSQATGHRRHKRNRERLLSTSPRCVHCGAPADRADHVIPVSHDPTLQHDPTNLQPSCDHCNASRGNAA